MSSIRPTYNVVPASALRCHHADLIWLYHKTIPFSFNKISFYSILFFFQIKAVVGYSTIFNLAHVIQRICGQYLSQFFPIAIFAGVECVLTVSSFIILWIAVNIFHIQVMVPLLDNTRRLVYIPIEIIRTGSVSIPVRLLSVVGGDYRVHKVNVVVRYNKVRN